MSSVVIIELHESDYLKIPKEVRDSFIEIKHKPERDSFPESEQWVELKKEANKAYKKLKDLEYNLTHKTKNYD